MKKINPYESASTVILGGGDYPSASVPVQILSEASTIVVCDGASNEFVARGGVPTAIVGDGDSIDECVKAKYLDRLYIVAEQDTNDQTKAVMHLLNRGFTTVSIVGATGKREDHTLGNISLLIDYLKMGVSAKIFTDYGVFFPVSGSISMNLQPGKQISIFNNDCTRLHDRGLKYPIRPFSNWWQGTLNEVASEQVDIDADGFYIIFLQY